MIKDGELTIAPNSGIEVCRFALAVPKKFKKEGQPEADFPTFVAFKKKAELISALTKGTMIGITGSITTGSYTDKEGNKRYTTDILVEELTFLEKKQGNSNNPQQFNTLDDFQPGGYNMTPIDDGDIPFS